MTAPGGSPGGDERGDALGAAGQQRAAGDAASAPVPWGEPGIVIGLLGPTTVGKSAVAVVLAASLDTQVISCDSMQVYRGFPVLTNQPAVQERRGVEHALIGFVDPLGAFSAVGYAGYARPLISAEIARGGAALLAGGTGLYLRAAVAPLEAAPGDAKVRARLEERAAAEGPDVLHRELAGLDAAAAQAVDPRNARRVIRALEAVLVGGDQWSGRDDLWAPHYDRPTLIVGLTLDRGELYQRIDARAGRMIREGAVDEVLRFREERGPEATTPGGPGIRNAIGYEEICRYLDGEISRDEAAADMAAATRRYARRQLTWLRKLKDAVMIDVQDRDPEAIAREILDQAFAKRTAEEPRHR